MLGLGLPTALSSRVGLEELGLGMGRTHFLMKSLRHQQRQRGRDWTPYHGTQQLGASEEGRNCWVPFMGMQQVSRE